MPPEYEFDLNTPFKDYPKEIQDVILYGTGGKSVKVYYEGQRGKGVYDVAFEGLVRNVEKRYRETSAETSKQEYENFMKITPCKECGGRRLRKESLAVTVGEKNIGEVTEYSVKSLKEFLDNMDLTETQLQIGIIKRNKSKSPVLIDVIWII